MTTRIPSDPSQPTTPKRRAISVKTYTSATEAVAEVGRISQYLPDNYKIEVEPLALKAGYFLAIEGHDKAGWTLDEYVIPRLASGLIWFKEVT